MYYGVYSGQNFECMLHSTKLLTMPTLHMNIRGFGINTTVEPLLYDHPQNHIGVVV